MLYIKILPNRGARIGHQAYEYIKIVTFCKKMNYFFLYEPFIGNSKHFNNVLSFDKLYDNKIVDNFDVIHISSLSEDTLFEVFDTLNSSDRNTIIAGDLSDAIWLSKKMSMCVTTNDMLETYKDHSNKLCEYYKYPVYKSKYNICVHIRRGDIVNNETRKLDLEYFELILKSVTNNLTKQYDIFVTTEKNCEDITKFLNTFNANLIMTSDTETFKYMVNADILIASKSGFSNLCHLLSKNIVIRNKLDWNKYYNEKEIIASNDGSFDIEKFKKLESEII